MSPNPPSREYRFAAASRRAPSVKCAARQSRFCRKVRVRPIGKSLSSPNGSVTGAQVGLQRHRAERVDIGAVAASFAPSASAATSICPASSCATSVFGDPKPPHIEPAPARCTQKCPPPTAPASSRNHHGNRPAVEGPTSASLKRDNPSPIGREVVGSGGVGDRSRKVACRSPRCVLSPSAYQEEPSFWLQQGPMASCVRPPRKRHRLTL